MTTLPSALLPADSSEAITVVLLDFSQSLIPRLDAFWEAKKQAKYVEAVENSYETDPFVLRFLQREYKSFPLDPSKNPNVFMKFGSFTFRVSTRLGKTPSRTQQGFAATSSGSRPVRRPKLTSPSRSP